MSIHIKNYDFTLYEPRGIDDRSYPGSYEGDTDTDWALNCVIDGYWSVANQIDYVDLNFFYGF